MATKADREIVFGMMPLCRSWIERSHDSRCVPLDKQILQSIVLYCCFDTVRHPVKVVMLGVNVCALSAAGGYDDFVLRTGLEYPTSFIGTHCSEKAERLDKVMRSDALVLVHANAVV